MQGAEERRLRRMNDTPQGGAIEGNAADDTLMVDQGWRTPFDTFGNDMYGYAKIDTRGRCHEN
ncbi:MAG: hypothetical protein JRJ51_00355 [Deltaproteobacteria bacterium]|nr:hypothetical protein [Deltaproteobacteria bacterium]